MNSLVLVGSIALGPVGAGDCAFPAGTCNVPFTSYPQSKSAGSSFRAAKQVNSPLVFVPIDGVGATETVTQGNFLYLRTTSPMQVRLTMQPVSGPDVVSVLFVQGLLIQEFPTSNYLKLIEALGVGTIEYLASGNL